MPVKKSYSDNLKLSEIAKKIDKAINEIPMKESQTARGRFSNIFQEPRRMQLEQMFGTKTVENIKKMVAADEVWPQDLGILGSGLWRTFLRETPKNILRLKKGDIYPQKPGLQEALKTSAEEAYQRPVFKGGAIERFKILGRRIIINGVISSYPPKRAACLPDQRGNISQSTIMMDTACKSIEEKRTIRCHIRQ